MRSTRPYKWLPLLLVLVVARVCEGQINMPGDCPDYYTSILFTPKVMMDLVERGQSFLMVTGGSMDDRTSTCQALSFHREQTYSYSYRDSTGKKHITAGTYFVNFPSFTKTSSIVINGLKENILGADSSGTATLVPVAYGFGISVFVTCRNSYWGSTHQQQYFMFVDRSVDLASINYLDMLQKMAEANIIPEELQGHLKIAFPDQTCKTCRRSSGQCIIKPQTAFIQNFINSTRLLRTDDREHQITVL